LIGKLAGCVVLGFSIYGLVDSQSASRAIENGASIIAGKDESFTISQLYTWYQCIHFFLSDLCSN
jgi:hypothetical protein